MATQNTIMYPLDVEIPMVEDAVIMITSWDYAAHPVTFGKRLLPIGIFVFLILVHAFEFVVSIAEVLVHGTFVDKGEAGKVGLHRGG